MGKQTPSIPAPQAPPEMPRERDFDEKSEKEKAAAAAREKKNIGRRQTILTNEDGAEGQPKTKSLGIMGGK